MTNQALLDDFLLFNKEILPINDPKTFVFCNFNTIDKMEPIMFHVWMSILHRVPNSVLWLLQPLRGEGKTIQRILLQEAQARGIFLSRILFAPKKHKTHHLNRLKHADLFLDSLIYNAHTTASDALWTNLPILTFHGDTFPSRVAASLIQQAFGKETQEADVLIASSLKEYEDLAVLLATNKRQLLMPLRYELSKRVSIVTPLFDTKRITNHLETAYEVIYEVKQGQNKHFHLLIDPQDARVSNTTANTKRRLQVAMNQALVLQQSETSESQVQVLEFSQRIYKRILQVEPKDTNILHRLGIVSYQQQKYPEAIDFLTQAIEISPTNALFYMHRGIVYAEMNASSSAIQDVSKIDHVLYTLLLTLVIH
jgi:predicted O-linked N-acetylglucosamine transferase (SPINDLY family)